VNKLELDAETFEAATARLAAMNLSAPEPESERGRDGMTSAERIAHLTLPVPSPEPPARSPRSDKDTKRTPKAQTLSIEAVSAMSAEQAQELIRLVAARNETLKNWEDAKRVAVNCEVDFKQDAKDLQDFIEALAK